MEKRTRVPYGNWHTLWLNHKRTRVFYKNKRREWKQAPQILRKFSNCYDMQVVQPTMSENEDVSSNWEGVMVVWHKTRRRAKSNSPPADGGGVGRDFKWCKHHQMRNFCSVFCWRNWTYSSGGYETVVFGRAPTVGDTAVEEGKDETACGGETEEADTSVPATAEVSSSRRSWSNETSDSVATVKGGDAGTGGWAGCERGSTADVDGAGDVKAAS